MRKFQFSLEAALSLRERAVEAAESALRSVQTEWNDNQARQETLAEEVRAAELAATRDPELLDPRELAALERYRRAAQKRRTQLQREGQQIRQRLEEKQSALRLAERDRKLLERLKAKARSRWQEEFDKEQQMLAEEAYLSRWGR